MGVSLIKQNLDICASAAAEVTDVESFKAWTRQFVKSVICHGALACGYGRIHSAGVSMDYVIGVDYPVEHLEAISNAAGAIDTPLMRHWLVTRSGTTPRLLAGPCSSTPQPAVISCLA